MNLNPIKANMTEIELGGMRVLFSYKTAVAFEDTNNATFYKTEKKWSHTTNRHINQWLAGRHAYEIPQEELDRILAEVK